MLGGKNHSRYLPYLLRQRFLGKVVSVPPNQSLKLTEPAVDDFAARQKNFLRKSTVCRAYSLPLIWLHVAQLSSGSLGGNVQLKAIY